MASSDKTQFRNLPSVDKLMRSEDLNASINTFGREAVREAARDALANIRSMLRTGNQPLQTELQASEFLPKLCREIAQLTAARSALSLAPVFNLTGTVIHTNLGRAPLPANAIDALQSVSRQAVNLEFDLSAGSRGDRDSHVEKLICQLTGAEAATVVNNNAAAVVLVLTTLAVGRDVLISRGELVEIGGAFRIPEVMGSAGCHLKEVGATNRTHLADFQQAIDDNTALLMKVHTSNYEIMGFAKAVDESELSALAHQHDLPFVVDLGSGTLIDLGKYGLPREPTVADSLQQGVDLVTFSGDKLLGGPQAGIVAGKRELVDRVKKNPLKRALRVDKLTLAALGAVLQLYNNPSELSRNLPILRDLTRPADEIMAVARNVLPAVSSFLAEEADIEITACKSQIGSGALPVDLLESVALKLTPRARKGADSQLNDIALRFRRLATPVVGRIHDGSLFFDLRCLQDVEGFCKQLGA
ncbi:MAG: L-seryl-tRNA(Sec) selenium transferase [Gammaproteobacteria bacterium]|nr:L-seryl-tRNA(Sec) selenium transferase [Gammaproteobacteria bacterium]